MLHKAYPRGYLGKHQGTYLDYGIPKDYIGDLPREKSKDLLRL
jgi:hypothetical protein